MTLQRAIQIGFAVFLLLMALATPLLAQNAKPTQRRARPPKWTAEDLNVFFDDAREKLVGERPDFTAQIVSTSPAEDNPTANSDAVSGSQTAWSKLIDADTVETEIKRLTPLLASAVASPSTFKGGAYEDCRRTFSELALLFAISSQYDGDIRWKDSAPALSELFARAGRNCKVGTDQTFNESKQRHQDLADLIAGSRPALSRSDVPEDWAQIADRPPLMQRLEIAHQERLTKWLANQREFKNRVDDLRHEAQIMAVIADAIGRNGYDYAEDEEYARLARELRQAAIDMAAAAELENFEQAQNAGNRATKACADCHDLYRG